MRRWSLPVRIAAGLVAAVVAVHSAGWWLLSRQVNAGYDLWLANQRAMGWTVTAGSPGLGGWPLAGGIDVPGLTITGPDWRWTAEQVALRVQPWAPGRLRIAPSGHQSIVAGAFHAGIDARSLLVTLSLPGGDDPAWDGRGVTLDTPFGRVGVESIGGHLTNGGTPTLSAEATGVALPPGPAYLLGPVIARAGLDATGNKALPVPRSADLAAWRDAGGTIRLDAVRLAWGTLTLDATGTAALDRALQPVADLRVAMTGQDSALDTAIAQGLLQPRAALAIRAVLGLLSRASPGPGGAAGTLPVSLRDGSVAVAGFPVARLPPVAWPP